MQSEPSSSLGRVLKAKLENRNARSALWTLPEPSGDLVDFSSNDFLSLSTSPGLRSSFFKELTSDNPEFRIGSSSTRVLDGNSKYALSLETHIATFHNAPSGLLFTSGFDANVSIFGYLPQPGDVIIYDELIHASVHEGMRVSRAGKLLSFSHNSSNDFRRVLEQCVAEDELLRTGERNVFVSVEALYSMDGDTSPVAELAEILNHLLPLKNGHLIVDEAHSTGVIGASGRGIVCDLGLESRIFVRLHTFGKAPACTGAIVLCSPLVRLYLINFARPFIYTTAMAFPSLAALKASYSMIQDVKTEDLRQNIRRLMHNLHTRLQTLSIRSIASGDVDRLIRVPEKCPEGSIFPIKAPQALSLATYCRQRGYSVNAIWPPAVPRGSERVRICVHAANTQIQIDGLVKAVEDWVELTKERAGERKAQIESRL